MSIREKGGLFLLWVDVSIPPLLFFYFLYFIQPDFFFIFFL